MGRRLDPEAYVLLLLAAMAVGAVLMALFQINAHLGTIASLLQGRAR